MKALALKPSQFNVIIEDYPETGKHLLYNTLSSAVIAIDDRGRALFSTFGNSTDSHQPISWNAEGLAFIQTLKKQGVLVPRESKEGERYLKTLRTSSNQKGGKLEITLLTNLGPCIHKCIYCYQNGAHIGGRLIGQFSKRAVDFIKEQCKKLEVEKLWLCYYGSEPLTNPQAITDTATELQRFCRKHRMKFRFGLVTSGYLLTRKLVEQFIPLGFVRAQITIDGPKEIHNQTRPLQSGKGTYDQIMGNLEEYAGLIHTDVLTVVHQDRIPAAYRIIDILAEKGFAERRVRMLFSPQSPDYRPETIQINTKMYAEADTELMTIKEQLLIEIADLSVYAHKKGLLDNLLPQRTWCAMQRHDERHLVIEPNGVIRTCPNLIGRVDYAAGHVKNGVSGIDTRMKDNYQRSPQCLQCPYLPICADCRVDTLQETGDIFAPNTHIHEYDLLVPKLVKAYYDSAQCHNSRDESHP